MSDLIDRQPTQNNDSNTLKAMDCVSRQGMCDSLDKYRIEKMLEGKDVSLVWECIDKVLQEPSAQPEIIRCKDCMYWDVSGYCVDFMTQDENGFCSWAERRKDE